MQIGNLLQSRKSKIILALVGVYLLSVGISFAVFSYLRSPADKLSDVELDQKRGGIDLTAPKTEECPLNGQMHTKAEHDIWGARRPLGIMIENHEDSRPQSGLSKADVVYEAVAEGGITRLLAVFFCGASAEEVQVGPVRSARTYFLDWVSEYGDFPLYVHVGGANTPGRANALGQIGEYGWDLYNDLNQFSIGFPTFWRDYERLGRPVATEHTMYSTTDKLWEVAQERELASKNEDGDSWDADFVSWEFVDGEPPSAEVAPKAGEISFSFWKGYDDYAVSWQYDAGGNGYKRMTGEKAHKDLNNDEQIMASNVVVLFTTERGPIDALKHMLYTTTGKGKALVFQNGDVISGTWSKKTRTARTKFMDSKGKEISFVRGPIWIEVLRTGSKVDY
ncbi:hypothetical protein CMO96_03930 [Candidatus Woesebacteria bacterium]|nr:hypothetical protein [Candidatus Woesebacteria bacterium]